MGIMRQNISASSVRMRMISPFVHIESALCIAFCGGIQG